MTHIATHNKADEVVHAFLVNVYSKYSGLHKILSDKGIEFKYKLFAQVALTLEMKQILSFPYYPQGNRCIENVHNFYRIYIWKHVFSKLAWDEVVHIACAAHNFALNEHSKQSALFTYVQERCLYPVSVTIESKTDICR